MTEKKKKRRGGGGEEKQRMKVFKLHELTVESCTVHEIVDVNNRRTVLTGFRTEDGIPSLLDVCGDGIS